MSLAFQSGESIKQALYEELHNILNPDKDIRTGAEAHISQLKFTEGESWQLFRIFPPFQSNALNIFQAVKLYWNSTVIQVV